MGTDEKLLKRITTSSEVVAGKPDNWILNAAITQQRTLVTNDKDFGELLFRSGRHHSGIILLRLTNETAPNKIADTRRWPDVAVYCFMKFTNPEMGRSKQNVRTVVGCRPDWRAQMVRGDI